MLKARCTEDGRIYTAQEFSQFPVEELARKRKLLQCAECGGSAFFRHASSIGRAACFGARPHSYGCILMAQDYSSTEFDMTDDKD